MPGSSVTGHIKISVHYTADTICLATTVLEAFYYAFIVSPDDQAASQASPGS
jgi:hypothetical protein